MNLHEYQAKQLFKQYGLPILEGQTANTADDVVAACHQINSDKWAIKAQVHAGGRGKAGGVIVTSSTSEARAFADKWLGQRLVTYQSGEEGQPVNCLLIEAASMIDKELYLGVVVDRSSRRVVVMASRQGGMDIEQVAKEQPDDIHQVEIDPLTGAQPYQGRELGYQLGLEGSQIGQFTTLFLSLVRMFIEKDISLVEINPLAILDGGDLCCLDAKISVDENALYRHPDLAAMDDITQRDIREARASEHALNYVALKGNIGCMVNGAGLAMGVMDTIKLSGGAPANFLDVGGGATRERVAEAFKIILSDTSVKAVLVNIFGGIVRCDLIADGIIGAIKEVEVEVPVIVRLEGTNAEEGKTLLSNCGLNITSADGLEDAATKSVALAGGANL